MNNPKIERTHLARRAVVYLRQSTMKQVHVHRESTKRQYALSERAKELGWPSHAIEVVDEDGRPLPPGSIGEVRVRSPFAAREYVGDPDTTSRAHRDGWFHLGDTGHLDADGFLYLAGRVDDRINVGGNKLYPFEIEEALLSHPDVADAAAVGIPSARHQEVPVAAVVLRRAQPRTSSRNSHLVFGRKQTRHGTQPLLMLRLAAVQFGKFANTLLTTPPLRVGLAHVRFEKFVAVLAAQQREEVFERNGLSGQPALRATYTRARISGEIFGNLRRPKLFRHKD